jgi:ribonuclease D
MKNQARGAGFDRQRFLLSGSERQSKTHGALARLAETRIKLVETLAILLKPAANVRCLFHSHHHNPKQATSNLSVNISYRYLIDPDETRQALRQFAQQEIIGLDTETFWDFQTKQNYLSLLQLAAPTGEVLVIDALAAGVEAAQALIEDPKVWMAAHNARFDDGVLRGAGFTPHGFVDTLRLARRTLRLPSFGLAAVSEHLFGVRLDKSHQRSDWRQRPLAREQLDYAALDAQIALRVYLQLTAELREQGRLEMELRRAKLKPDQDKNPPYPKRTRRASVKLRPLTADERELFERLCLWRKQAAQSERLPVYLICSDKTLEHLAIARPRTLATLGEIYGLGPAKIAKFGAQLLDKLA